MNQWLKEFEAMLAVWLRANLPLVFPIGFQSMFESLFNFTVADVRFPGVFDLSSKGATSVQKFRIMSSVSVFVPSFRRPLSVAFLVPAVSPSGSADNRLS